MLNIFLFTLIEVESRRRPNEDEMAHPMQEGLPPPQHILPQGIRFNNYCFNQCHCYVVIKGFKPERLVLQPRPLVC
jgi:hypothetical protein